MLATTGETWDTISAPSSCLRNSPWKVKYVVWRHNSRRWAMCSSGRSVLSVNVLSYLSLWRVTSKASPTGTLVNKDFTSKLTITSSGCWRTPISIFTKCFEFFTRECVRPVSGVISSVMCFDRWYVGDPILVTMGPRGISGLWILGSPSS